MDGAEIADLESLVDGLEKSEEVNRVAARGVCL